jgi:predicted O-methyltransferase YrrM
VTKEEAMKDAQDHQAAMELNERMRAFMECRLLLTAIELDVFNAIGAGATAAEVAQRLKTHPRATEMLLNALAATELLLKTGASFENTPLTARYLTTASPDDSRLASLHLVGLWHRWSTLTDCVRQGTSVALQRGGGRDEQQTRAFIAAMHHNASAHAGPVVAQLDLTGARRVMDLGGGSGAYAIAMARQAPGLEITVFDVPTVVPLTQGYIAEAGLAGKIKTQAGDMANDELGAGYDLIWVSAICHMWGPDENLALFQRIHRALAPGGRLVVQDFILDDAKTAPRMAAVFALNMLVNTRAGSSYSRREYEQWMKAAGFKSTEYKALPGPTGLMIGTKKG